MRIILKLLEAVGQQLCRIPLLLPSILIGVIRIVYFKNATTFLR